MSLKDIAAELEALAKAEWAKVEAEGIKLEQEIEPVLESGLVLAAKQFGQLAIQTVMNLMGAAGAGLAGGAKLNLTATTIKDAAVQAGIAIADQDITALAQNSYTAVIGAAPPAGSTLAQEGVAIAEKAAGDVLEQ